MTKKASELNITSLFLHQNKVIDYGSTKY